MASSSRGGCCYLLLLALSALATVEALPITSRPIEGNAQLLAWEEWLRLPHEQKTLEKEKKVTAKSIFTLPFRHCPPGHKLYNERCIPQINIDPTDLVKQELLGLVGEGEIDPNNGSPTGNTDYDYSDTESEEFLFDVPLVPLMQTGAGSSAAEDQALPSEDAPLKFNIFESKFPTAPEAATATATTTSTTTATTGTAVATTTPTPTIATLREDALKEQRQPNKNRIVAATEDLQADSSNTMPSTTSLSISSSSSSSNIGAFSNIGNIDAIVLPAGAPLDAEPSVQLVTSSLSSPTTSDADGKADTDTDTETDTETDAEAEAEGEADLEQLLKVDAFLPAYGSSVDLLPPFSHRRVSPLLSADLDPVEEDSATDIVPTGQQLRVADGDVASTTPTTTATGGGEQKLGEHENRLVLKKSKVQPVHELSSTVATTTTATATATTARTMTTTIASSTATKSTVAASAGAGAGAGVAAIHQDAIGNVRDDDRFYYQHLASNVAASTSSTGTSSTTVASSYRNADGDLDVLNDMASSDNLMTNTIGGQSDSDKAASEINFEQELRIINELVKGKRRLSQMRQQQQNEQQPQTSTSTSTSTSIRSSSSRSTTATIPTTPPTTTAIIKSIESSSDSSSTGATATASDTTVATATENTTFWSKLMPMLGMSSTEATAATATTATTPTITTTTIETTTTATATETTTETTTAATATINGSVAESSIATQATATTRKSTEYLSINSQNSNINSKIVRVDDSIEENPITTSTTPATSQATKSSSSNSSSNDDNNNYTPFWWLPNIGWRLDRQVDKNGEDRSLLLRFFRTFQPNESDATATAKTTTTAVATATLPSRR